MKSRIRSRAATIAALSLVLSVGMAAGCGGDGDSNGGPWDNYTGLWFPEDPSAMTGFTLSCTDVNFGMVFMPGTKFRMFGSLQFEHGELTDLAETSGSCNLLNYDINGTTATVVNPDPYLAGEDDPTAACIRQFNLFDSMGYAIPTFAVLTPDATWSVKLLSDKTQGGGDRLQLTGSGSVFLFIDDGTPTGIVSDPECTYTGMDTFLRLTRP